MFGMLPWKFFVKAAARRYGVLDPATLLARLRRFAQPSEVAEPLELLRAGIIFHARGLLNAKVIQHNLDWVWPYWVERQFNPSDKSFIPRAFSFSHINLTHRNWTAVGLPDIAAYPIVDPRGLVTPLYDGWSIDFWIITANGKKLLPSKLDDADVYQLLHFDPTPTVVTRCAHQGMRLETETRMLRHPSHREEVTTEISAVADEDSWLAVAVRPYNPEGVQFINRIEQLPDESELRVNSEATVRFSRPIDLLRMAHYAEGDVYLDIHGNSNQKQISCEVGMATGAALFRIRAGIPNRLSVAVTLDRDLKSKSTRLPESWQEALLPNTQLHLHDEKTQFLYDAAVHTLLLLSADDLVPGPYTYRRFWFRDACLMLHPLILMGQVERAERILAGFPARQTMAGYFLSQEGEWDSNGQVLWIAARFAELTGKPLDAVLEKSLRSGVEWLAKKRIKGNSVPGADGLLPAGFSAEHLGPNDYYYWDDFWAWAGLKSIAAYWQKAGANDLATRAADLAADYAISIETSIAGIPASRAKRGIPAAPGRRMDAGAVGSMVADYPLQLYPPGDSRMMETAGFLMENCFSNGGFFQEMIHSGINAYLTLDLAQTLLRAGNPQFANLVRRVAALASPTGQWPEAIHPQTLGGCMGDGQHGWAAAEWIMMIRNCFVREESGGLIIGSGILPEWLGDGKPVSFGPTLTAWGAVTVRLENCKLTLEKQFRASVPFIKVQVPGFASAEMGTSENSIQLQKL